MATVQLTDAVIPLVYQSYQAVNTMEKTAFWGSGVVVQNPLMQTALTEGGKSTDIPFWNDINSGEEPNYSNDDPDDNGNVSKINAGEMFVRKTYMNKIFSDMDLVAILAGSDPMTHIANRFATYWQRTMQKRLIATSLGVLASNVANNSSDMVVDISGGTGDAAIFSSGAYLDAAYTMGDAVDSLSAVAVHSEIMKKMAKLDDIAVVRGSDGQITYATYKGHRLIVDDSMPVTGTGSNRVYTSVLFGAGAIGYAETTQTAEVWDNKLAGNGGGQSYIKEKRNCIIHPLGFNWVEGTLTEKSPTNADLVAAAHWTRAVPRKNVPMAFLKSKA